MNRNLYIFFIASPALAFILVAANIYYKIQVWTYDGPAVIFEVKPGEPFSKINARLGAADLISSTKLFYRYAKFNGILTSFKAGKYEIKTQSNMLKIIEILTLGQSLTVGLTIPEGKNLYEIAQILFEQNIIENTTKFIQLCKSANQAQLFGIQAEGLEGYLYPDTYYFSEKMPEQEVIKVMVNNFFKKIEGLDFSWPGLNRHQLVTLASIVEKETGAAWERPIIAGVFHNRLKKKMRLQSDPTTIYGIWEKYNGNLRKSDLLEKTPYNTYKIFGLPEGPISNPGIESLTAVIHPEIHNYLYFVSKNDGTHIFSKSYKDHSRAVDDFQKNRNAREGKSWRDLQQ